METKKTGYDNIQTKRNHHIIDMIIEHTSTQQFLKIEGENIDAKKNCAKIIFNIKWGRGQDVFFV